VLFEMKNVAVMAINESAMVALTPLRSGHCTRRMALFFKTAPLLCAGILLNFGGETRDWSAIRRPRQVISAQPGLAVPLANRVSAKQALN
jgi:hypothetical protein